MISMLSRSQADLRQLMSKQGMEKMMPKLAGGRPLGHGGKKKRR
jgi:hypothetical protein